MDPGLRPSRREMRTGGPLTLFAISLFWAGRLEKGSSRSPDRRRNRGEGTMPVDDIGGQVIVWTDELD
jgi:hypothetical protein